MTAPGVGTMVRVSVWPAVGLVAPPNYATATMETRRIYKYIPKELGIYYHQKWA